VQPWLAQGVIPALVEEAGPAIADLDRLTAPGSPALVRQFYAPRVVAALRRLWSERAAFLGALERLPRTFCHGDGHRRNFFSRTGPDGTEQTVAIDWEYAGHGALGEEMAALVMSNLLLFEAAGIAPHDLDGTCFAAYVEGLRAAGWDGDLRTARLGYTGAAVMRYGLGVITVAANFFGDLALRPFAEQLFGRSVSEVVAAWDDELWPYLLGLAEEARRLLRAAG
jgi:hypothetical protein